jgi:inner membrane protein involved in colicin E2 resistance
MSEAAEILVIILSVFLGFFLLLAIILLVMLIRVTKKIQDLAESARSTADHIDKAVSGIGKVVSPALIAKFVMGQFAKAKKKGGK